ncbi:MAG: ATP-binding protein [Bacteroidota bacterium]|nr:ATP-binding protein [Bacteroidota bacterium]
MPTKFKEIFINIITSGINGDYESDSTRKAIIINTFSILGLIFLIYYGIKTLINYEIWYSIVLFGFSLVLLINFIFLRLSKNFQKSGKLLVIVVTFLEFFFIISGGQEKTGFVWYYTYPLLSLFILGLSQGTFFVALLLSGTLALFFIQPDFLPNYDNIFMLRFVTSFILVSLMSIAIEFVRDVTYTTLIKANQKKSFYLNKVLKQRRDILTKSKNLEKANFELERHRKYLEEIVQERTAELIKAKDKAEESDRLKSAFLANMSHEIRTPMNAIVGFSNLLIDPEVRNTLKDEMVHHVTQNANTLMKLIDDIITISKIETDQIDINISKVDIHQVIEDLYAEFDEFKIILNKQHLKFILDNDVNNKKLYIQTDKTHVKKILLNILDNAFKFTEKGEIHFGYKLENSHITFYIKDTGIGLSQEQQKEIFNQFTKAIDPKKKLYNGAGLGLSICKSLVKYLNGEITVSSINDENGDQSGSTFQIKLPINP